MLNIFRRFCNCSGSSTVPKCPRFKGGGCTREVLNINEITYEEMLRKIKEGAILIDTRTKQEFLEGHLNGAILIPYFEIYKKVQNIIPNKEQTIVVYCQNGGRSQKAYEILYKLGYSNIYNFKQGIEGI